ncbi:hypothetical protein BGZ76_010977 [Entomortierella beljakovae]|nr:hypothetical protein BGZ76_010977 [Entomortierella beljakovae]
MSVSTATTTTPQSFLLSSPDRVVFRTLSHPLASTNKRVTLSLKRTPTPNTTEPGTPPPNSQSPNTYRQSSSNQSRFSTNTESNTYPNKPTPQIITLPSTPVGPIRKQSVPLHKNGLPVKSAMKSPVTATFSCTNPLSTKSLFRSQSSPCLTSPKFVHFNSNLEHVRLFLQGETPSCVADRETIIDAGDRDSKTSEIKLRLVNWNPIASDSFKPANIDSGEAPLRVENIALSQDQTELNGTILVQNIAFHKVVSVRYTVNFWQTKSEVNAEFKESIPGSAMDRFAFKIALDMEKSSVEKTFCFAVCYQVIGREFWDSNNGMNYQVECKRVVVETPSPTTTAVMSKQKSNSILSSQIQDFSKPVLKKATNNRYDLSSSLSAAYNQPSGLSTRSRFTRPDILPATQSAYRPSEYITPIQPLPGFDGSLYATSPKFQTSYISTISPPEHLHFDFDKLSVNANVSPIAIPSNQTGRPNLGSPSYYDFVDRYCFYESSPHSSPISSYPNSPSTPCTIRG